MPEEGIKLFDRQEILSYEEIINAVKLLSELGIKMVRLTGGEPLIRDDILDLVSEIKKIKGITDISVTTNGLLLDKYLKDLHKFGIERINISLDSLDPKKYKEITRGGDIRAVLSAISNSIKTGIKSIKINTVITPYLDKDDIYNFIKLTIDKPIHVRFIEMMPVVNLAETNNIECSTVSGLIDANIDDLTREIFSILGSMGSYYKIDEAMGFGPAVYYKLKDSSGSVGFIINDKNYCSYCNRIRLTPQGTIRLCLFSDREYNIKSRIRNGCSSEDIKKEILDFVKIKPENREDGFKCSIKFDKNNQLKISDYMNKIGG
jgi:cyclic pyranopterin phosphate synthase